MADPKASLQPSPPLQLAHSFFSPPRPPTTVRATQKLRGWGGVWGKPMTWFGLPFSSDVLPPAAGERVIHSPPTVEGHYVLSRSLPIHGNRTSHFSVISARVRASFGQVHWDGAPNPVGRTWPPHQPCCGTHLFQICLPGNPSSLQSPPCQESVLISSSLKSVLKGIEYSE